MRPRYERRQRGGGGALLLLIAAAALVVAVLAIFTDVFSGKKAPDKDTALPSPSPRTASLTGPAMRTTPRRTRRAIKRVVKAGTAMGTLISLP